MKRNKAIILVATACVAAGALVALAACEAPPEHEHTYDNGTVTVAATCTQNGEKTFKCTGCNDSYIEVVTAVGHDWETEYTVDSVADCIVDGAKSVHCKNCEATKDIVTITAAHDWETEYTVDSEPTCTEQGVKSYHCKNCDETDGATPIDSCGHNAGKWTVDSQYTPTLKQTGKAVRKCANTGCNEVLVEHELPALNNEDYSVTVVTPSTCKAAGTADYVYDKDGVSVKFTAGVELAAHKYGNSLDTTDKSTGEIFGYTCEVCGAVDDANSYIYMDDSALGNSNLNTIDVSNYYFEFTTDGYLCLRLDLIAPGRYELTFEHLKDTSVAYIDQILFDGESTKRVAYGGRNSATIQSAYESVATIAHNGKQAISFTFDATDSSYVGHYLHIRLMTQVKPVFTVSVNYEMAALVINEGDTLNSLTVPCKIVKDGAIYGGVTILEVGDVEEGVYMLQINVLQSLTRSMVFFGKNIQPEYESIFGPASEYGMGGAAEVIWQSPNAQVRDGVEYKVTGSGSTFTIELTLKKGDRLIFAHTNGNDGTIGLTMTKA
jgi:hypothetical protein